ncbi:Argininosuccinate lyase [Bienertia sinuspersici]
MVENDNIFNKVDALKKRMAEYAFVDGLQKKDMWSLAESNHILDNIVNAWAYLLNVENKRRSPESSNRFFFTINAFVILCTDTYFHSKASLEERQEILFGIMKKEMKHAQVNTLEKVDLVFFPVVASGHYYLLCINFMKGSLELIDNRLLDNKISFVQKYKNHPRTLLRAFATFYATFPLNKKQKYV